MTTQPGGFKPYGAVDLAALAQQKQAQERAASAGSTSGGDSSPAVIDVTDASFQTDVVDRSMTVPVVIDFWATWCGPCKQLSPILERFAEDDAGQWVLAKVDVDANQQLAAAAQVQSIPTVMVVWQGQVIPGFAGALPETQVRDFLNQVIALTGETDAGGTPEGVEGSAAGSGAGQDGPPEGDEPSDPLLSAAEDALMRDDFDAAALAYQEVLVARPDDTDALHGLAQVDLLRRTDGHDLAAATSEADQDPTNIAAQLLAADLQLLANDVDGAFDRLLAVVASTTDDDRDQIKDHLLTLLDLVGNDDPRVLSARQRLASALF